MRILSNITAATALAVMAASSIGSQAEARTYRHHRHYYYAQTYYPTRYCRYSPGTTGLIAGGVGGAVVGQSVVGHGLLGTALGAVGGAMAGRAIDRSMTSPSRCYYR